MNAGRLPHVVLVGAPRCGTTALSKLLQSHPDVFVAPEKEVDFFNVHWHRGVDWYKSAFEGARPGQRLFEATPLYMYSVKALDRAASILPEARMVVMLREPSARAWSHYWFNRGSGGEKRSFERCMRDELSGEAAGPFARQLGAHVIDPPLHTTLGPGYLSLGLYAHYVKKVQERWGRDRVKILFHEDLREDPERFWSEVLGHLNVAPAPLPALGSVNTSRRPKSILLAQILRSVAATHPAAHALVRRLIRANSRAGTQSPSLEASKQENLYRWYATANAELASLLARPLPKQWRTAS